MLPIASLLVIFSLISLDADAVVSQDASKLAVNSSVSWGKNIGSCHFIWPKMGGFYPARQPVYVLFKCEVPTTVGERASSVYKISSSYSVSCFMATIQHEAKEKGTISFGEVSGIDGFCSDFSISLPNYGDCPLVNFEFHIFADELFVDTIKVTLFPAQDGYFASYYNASRTCVYNASSQSCVEGSQTLPPRYYDFVEIGTSGYDTLIEQASDWHVGLSVEVLKDLQDTLPDRAGVIKVNAAIGDEAGWKDIYYLPNALVESLDFNFKELHKSRIILSLDTASRILSSELITPPDLPLYGVSRQVVPKVPARQMLIEHAVASIGLLKVDMNQLHNISAFLSVSEQGDIKHPRYVEYRSTKAFTYQNAVGHISELLSLGYRVYSVQIEDVEKKVSDSFDLTVFAELAMNSSLYWGQKEPYVADRVVSLTHPAMGLLRKMCFENSVGDPDIAVSLEQWKAGGINCHFILREGSEKAMYGSHRPSGGARVQVESRNANSADREYVEQGDVISMTITYSA